MIVWAFETLIASTLLMLLVLALRTPVRRSFGPNIAYALWALPALRMVLPPLPESWTSGSAAPLTQAGETIVTYVAAPLGVVADLPPEIAASDWSVWPFLIGAWVVGASGFIAYHLISHGRFCARVWDQAGSVRTVAQGNVEVIETGAAAGPLAFGIWRKYVAFPRDFAERYDPLERDLALAHELGHHARGDLLANWAALIVLGLHWFNPVAWRAFRAFRADQEMACDALVLSGRAPELRHAYGRAIVKSAHGGAVSAACHLHTINEVKGRLKMLTVHERKSRGRLLAGGATIAALTLTGLGATASGTQAAERVRTKVENTIGVDLAAIELPAALQAAPPAPPAVGAPPAPPAPEAEEAGAREHKRRTRVIINKDGKVDEYTSVDGGPMTTKDGKVVSRRFVFRDKDGQVAALDGAGVVPPMPPMPPMPGMPPEALAHLKNMPQVMSRNCGGGEGKAHETVIDSKDGSKRKIIICTDRIERRAEMAAKGAEIAERHAELAQRRGEMAGRHAMASALDGLRRARKSIEGNQNMTSEQRASALAGIDEALREMRANRD